MQRNRNNIKKFSRFAIVFPVLTIIGIGIFFVLSSFYEKSWSYNWNGIRNQIRDSVKVAEYNGFTSGWVGIVPSKDKNYSNQLWIMSNATESELLRLLEYPNGTVKTIAYEGLIRKPNFNNKADLVLRAISDKQYPIYYRTGCNGMEMSIGEYLVEFLLFINYDGPPIPPEYKNKFGFSEENINTILVEYRKEPRSWWR